MKSLNGPNDREFGLEFLKIGLIVSFIILVGVTAGAYIAFYWI